ncbi:ABC transporter ATP-binding protein [Shewanella livingstonensis]|uniref:ABC transporter ATP-binding protein n=1 Tax=Shewanella livingstonensis TaxID=150120 RepID=A0A3G8LV86_9GAMM|nr:ABC transporter ATP-binding protein [Shewanella livingstonensis]AZG73304.1 ABC transporter ATP-binding protein [Shewanella livingstonensis]
MSTSEVPLSINTPVLEGKSLHRSFGKRKAVDNASFCINRGDICAFLGPNGAGKTTLIKMLTGLISPDSGDILYDGHAHSTDRLALKQLIGVVPQHNNIDRELTPVENLTVHGLLYKMRGKALTHRINESLAFAELEEHRDIPSEKLSGGMKRKLVIARALMHNPKILFLDEPTVGLDPHSRRKMWDFLSKINKEFDCTIFLTTHYIEEAERMASRVIFIDRGKIIADSNVETLKQDLGSHVLEVGQDRRQEFFASRGHAMNRLAELAETVSIRQTTLEDAFLQMTGQRLVKNA